MTTDDNLELVHTLGQGTEGPRVLIIAGIHGDEFEPMLAANELLNILNGKIKSGSLTIIPVANPSAFELGKRCGQDGLDMARTFPGNQHGTITERMASQLAMHIKNADYLIDLHTGGQLFNITPLTGYLLHPSQQVLEKQQMMAEAFNLPLIWGTAPDAEGRTLSTARDHNIPAIYAECGGGSGISQNTIERYVEGCLNVLFQLKMIDYNVPAIPNFFYWLEDHRPGQGHLQSKMPSPAEGIFIPLYSPGEIISKGSIVGYIMDPINNASTNIEADDDGMVFMVRVSSLVRVGDTLGGILPIHSKTKKIIHAS